MRGQHIQTHTTIHSQCIQTHHAWSTHTNTHTYTVNTYKHIMRGQHIQTYTTIHSQSIQTHHARSTHTNTHNDTQSMHTNTSCNINTYMRDRLYMHERM